MVTMQKMTATWTGFTGAPGTTSIFFQGSSIIDPSVLRTFFVAYAPYIPPTVTIQVNSTGELVEPTDGKVMGTWSGTAPAAVVGTGTGTSLLATEGAQVRIETGAFRRGKHIRGRFYLIPSATSILQSNGTIAGSAVTALQAAADTLRSQSAAQIGVFHRPVYDYTVKPPLLKTAGEFIGSTNLVVLSKTASLRSRRD